MKLVRLTFLLVLVMFSWNGQAQSVIETIDGIYIERDTSSFPVKNQTILDGDIIAFDIPGFGDLLSANRILLKDVKLLFDNIPVPEFHAYVENLESGVVR